MLGRVSFLYLRRRGFAFHISVGLGRQRHGQAIACAARNGNIAKGHNARQRRDIANKLAELVIGADDFYADRQLGLEIDRALALRFEQFELEPTPEARLGDVDEEIGDFV